MLKSIRKNLIFTLLISLFVVSLVAISTVKPTTFADSEPLTYSNEYDAGKTYTKEELEERQNLLNAEIDGLKSKIGVELDINNGVKGYYLNLVNEDVSVKITNPDNYDDLAKNYLFGDTGLNGIFGIYYQANKLRDVFLSDEATLNFRPFEKTAVQDAVKTYLQKYNLADRYGDNFNRLVTDKLIGEFSNYLPYKTALENYATLNSDIDKAKRTINFYYDYYNSLKFGEGYANSVVYGPKDSEAKAIEEHDEKLINIVSKVAKATSFEDAESIIKKELASYSYNDSAKKDKGLKTYVERESSKIINDTSSRRDKLVTSSEEVFDYYDALGTLKYFDGEGYIDLKTGRLTEFSDEHGNDEDSIAIELLRAKYMKLITDAVEEARLERRNEYGISAEPSVSSNLNIAKDVIKKITNAGNLGTNAYTYEKNDSTVKVNRGSDVVTAYKDSYDIDGALKCNGADSRSLKSVRNKDTVSYDDDIVTITVTAKDKLTKANAIRFDCNAELLVKHGASLSVEKNIDDILKNPDDEKLGASVTDAEKAEIKGDYLYKYLVLTLREPVSNGNLISKTDFDDADDRYEYTVSVLFKDEFLKEQHEKLNVVNYYHTTITNVIQNDKIIWEGEKFMFTVDSAKFINELAFTQGADTGKLNPWLIIGIVAAIIIVPFIIWLIIKLVKNRKFKVVFNANGGKYNKVIKVKYREQFAYPKNPTKKGYVFMGWFTDKKFTTRFATTELMRKKGIKVYAKWIKESEYEKLNADYAKLGAEVKNEVATVDAQYFTSIQRDPQLEKIEAEKLSYEAKKAEEERKTEEVKLQAIREIERSKNSDEARNKAEQETELAKQRLQEALAERDALIAEARLDERNKCIQEVRDSNDVERAAREMMRARTASYSEPAPVDYEKLIEQARQDAVREAEARIRKELEEEAKKKAEEEARINALVEARIKAIEDARQEEANRKASEEARIEQAVNARLREMNMLNAQSAEDYAKRRAVEEARLSAELAMLNADRARRLDEERQRADEEARIKNSFNPAIVYDEIKAEISSYQDLDDLDYGLDTDKEICSLKVDGNSLVMEFNEEPIELTPLGYNVVKGDVLGSKFVISSPADVDTAYDILDEVMCDNGMNKARKAVVTTSTDRQRAEGFTYGAHKDRLPENVDEIYKVLRVYASSFAAKGEVKEDTPLIKMFVEHGKVYMYLNYMKDGLNACDEAMAGFKSFMTVKNVDDMRVAIDSINAMMKEHGLVRSPIEMKIGADDSSKGFSYTLKA